MDEGNGGKWGRKGRIFLTYELKLSLIIYQKYNFSDDYLVISFFMTIFGTIKLL